MEATRAQASQPGPASQPSTQAAAHAQKVKGGAPGTANALSANPGDFLALLAGLTDTPDAGAAAQASGDLLAPDALLGDADPQTADAAALAAWQGLLVPEDRSSPALGLLRGRADAGGEISGAAIQDVLFSKTGGRAQGLVAETVLLDASADMRGGPAPVSGTAHARASARANGTVAQRPDPASDVTASRASSTLDRMQGQPFGPVVALVPMEALAMGLSRAGASVERFAGSAPLAAELAGALGELVAGGAGVGQDASARASGGDAGLRDQGYGGGALTEPGGGPAVETVDSAGAPGDAAQASVEDQLAEQVAYWVNQETQNAELTVTRDGQPVEVSVTLSGNEAHVTFRSDQEHTREILDRSMLQLSDLLRGEGLVLSGMSVGTSSARNPDGGSGGSDQKRRRDDARQAQVSPIPLAGAGLAGSGRVSDRSVDVFV
ncbi:flagellar hook-length control protein FliK [Acidovorax sp. BL-A-41-H1]|uniref:flagellar hook-length control protein FliK n=1 Tax=Acidovorax sp. BL-A-41-H1 TaxID=3421102 RepID=UPI003F7A0F23